jgi:hypothetical protein
MLIVTIVGLLLVGLLAIANLMSVHRHLVDVREGEPRNAGLQVYGYHRLGLIPSEIVFDIRNVSGTNSPADVTRLLLQFAEKLKERDFENVYLSFKGEPRFLLKGPYFKQLGQEYGTQNPAYTIRTMPQNLFWPDGRAAFATWTGGMLGVLSKQMEDFAEFHNIWWLHSLLASRKDK